MAERPYYQVTDAAGEEVRINALSVACVMFRTTDGVNGRVIVYTGAPGEGGVVDLGSATAVQFAAFLVAFKNATTSGAPLPVDYFAQLPEAGSQNIIAAAVTGALSLRATPSGTQTYLYTTSHYASPLLVDDTIDNVASALNVAYYGAP